MTHTHTTCSPRTHARHPKLIILAKPQLPIQHQQQQLQIAFRCRVALRARPTPQCRLHGIIKLSVIMKPHSLMISITLMAFPFPLGKLLEFKKVHCSRWCLWRWWSQGSSLVWHVAWSHILWRKSWLSTMHMESWSVHTHIIQYHTCTSCEAICYFISPHVRRLWAVF